MEAGCTSSSSMWQQQPKQPQGDCGFPLSLVPVLPWSVPLTSEVNRCPKQNAALPIEPVIEIGTVPGPTQVQGNLPASTLCLWFYLLSVHGTRPVMAVEVVSFQSCLFPKRSAQASWLKFALGPCLCLCNACCIGTCCLH